MNNIPLVSCLCVTRNRVDLLKRAIACFQFQRYPSKELIVLSEEDDKSTLAYMQQNQGSNIKHIIVDSIPRKSLGSLRNIAIGYASGQYICQWDDDDWYHADRIAKQVSSAFENSMHGSILTQWIMYDEEHGQAYLSRRRLWEGSILVEKNAVLTNNIQYPPLQKGEDSEFIGELIRQCQIYELKSPELYVYTFHGRNTWNREHFNENFMHGKRFSKEHSALIGDVLNGKALNAGQATSDLLFL